MTEVAVMQGSVGKLSMDRYRALHRDPANSGLGRNTISADDLTTTFHGLAPGVYSACAVVNLGGDDLQVTCAETEVGDTTPAEVALDVRFG